jgi:hypothetical protein
MGCALAKGTPAGADRGDDDRDATRELFKYIEDSMRGAADRLVEKSSIIVCH